MTSYKLPCIITRGNNVYGPHQFPEKLVPKFTLLARRGEALPVHGAGQVSMPAPTWHSLSRPLGSKATPWSCMRHWSVLYAKGWRCAKSSTASGLLSCEQCAGDHYSAICKHSWMPCLPPTRHPAHVNLTLMDRTRCQCQALDW